MKTAPKPGTRVQFTAAYLRNACLVNDTEGIRRWSTVACNCGLCASGDFVAVNQDSIDDPAMPRHILRSNLERCR